MREILFLLTVYACVASYETSYRDSSGADCVAFGLGDHEVDVCHGRFGR